MDHKNKKKPVATNHEREAFTQDDYIITIATGENNSCKHWTNTVISWEQLDKSMQNPRRAAHTVEQYQSMGKGQRSSAKDGPGFVGGSLWQDGPRSNETIKTREVITLDADHVDSAEELIASVELTGYEAIIHSTHSHTAEEPRLRVLLLPDRPMTAQEYREVAQVTAMQIDPRMDPASAREAQFMYFPSCPADGEYIHKRIRGQKVPVDRIATSIKNQRENGKDLPDPRTKEGFIGYFCKAYNVIEAIETFLGDVYEPGTTQDRYTFIEGDGANGLYISHGGQYAYSHHSTDPANDGHQKNAFDLVRIHRFGTSEESFLDMVHLAKNDPEVQRLLFDAEDLPETGSILEYLEKGFFKEQKQNRDAPKVKTGFVLLDKALAGGLYPGLHLLGGATGLGKTAMAVYIADTAASQGVPVLYVSLEMGRYELVCRSLACISVKSDAASYMFSDIINGYPDQKRMNALISEYARKITDKLYILEGNFGLTVEGIRERVEQMPEKPLVIVDYIQAIEHQDPRLSDKQKIDHAVLSLKRMSRDLFIPVLVLSSFNRESTKRGKAGLESFKESGGLEYTADTVLGLRDPDEDEGIPLLVEAKGRIVTVEILKNRRGEKGIRVNLDYQPGYNNFREMFL